MDDCKSMLQEVANQFARSDVAGAANSLNTAIDYIATLEAQLADRKAQAKADNETIARMHEELAKAEAQLAEAQAEVERLRADRGGRQ